MRGDDEQSGHLFSYLSPEQRVPADHPLRPIREMTDAALARLSSRFALLYAQTGRPSVPPEHLLRALLLQVLYSIRSERSQRVRKRIEEVFGWMKTVGGMRKLKHRGGERVNWQFLFTAAAYNLVRMRTLMTPA